MRTIFDEFANADIQMSQYVRNTKEMARIEVLYFLDKGNTVRKILRSSQQKETVFYDKGVADD